MMRSSVPVFLLRLVVLAAPSVPLAAHEAGEAHRPFRADLPAGAAYALDARKLHPTQFSHGWREVVHKQAMMDAMSVAKLKAYLVNKDVPVVIGPGGVPYMTDGHHTLRSLIESKHADKTAYGHILANWADLPPEQFWQRMRANNFTCLKDAQGREQSPSALPTSLTAMQRDPYRGLAWGVMEAGGFRERKGVFFQEFRWADFFRDKVSWDDADDAAFAAAVAEAAVLARQPAAAGLPGYVPPGRPVTPAERHRATPVPDRIVLTWTGDPATTQAVTWRTSADVAGGLAEIAPAADGPQEAARTVTATTQALTTDLGPAHYHTVAFTGLAPDTLHAYRVGDGVNWSEWFHFRTAKAGPAPFTFLYFGDAQNDIRTHWSRVVREAFREAPRAAFTLHAGDLIDKEDLDAEWGEWFGAPAWVHATLPVVPTPGNHEYYDRGAGPEEERLWTTKAGATLAVTVGIEKEEGADGEAAAQRVTARAAAGRTASAVLDGDERFVSVDAGFTALTGYTITDLKGRHVEHAPLFDRQAEPGVPTLSAQWRPQFALPEHGPAGLEESVYYLDYQGVRIVSLNSNERHEEQAAWLRGVLGRNPQRWTVVTFHHPVFSPRKDRDNTGLRAAWKPVFDEFRVDLVLTGHDHTYARTGNLAGRVRVGTRNVPEGYSQAYDPAVGTVYVVSVSGPKMRPIGGATWALRAAEDTQLFQVITVDGDELRYEARTAADRPYDAFTLRKRSGAPNQLIEAPSAPPERRRPSRPAPANMSPNPAKPDPKYGG